VVEPGKVEISIGGKQPDQKSVVAKSVVKCNVNIVGEKVYLP